MSTEELQQLQEIKEDVSTIKELLTGNGTPHKGLLIRVDRLEQSAAIARRALWSVLTVLIVASIGFLGTAVVFIIKNS